MKQLLRIGFFTVLFVGLVIIVRAEELREDMRESLEYKKTSDTIELTDASRLLRKRSDERLLQHQEKRCTEARMSGLTGRIKRENRSYAGVVKNLKKIIPGVTDHGKVVAWFGLPDEIVHGNHNGTSLAHRARNTTCLYHIYLEDYPEPAANQYVMASTFHFTEKRPPLVGDKWYLLVTVNKETGLVDDYACYFGDGFVLRDWHNAILSEG
ncbi:MAG: hypothetical protein MJA29_06465 [Candidatus Omnitrophica bacterium]|nr:hypothetical protein [Candidatus Omnitrophota bacterium]